MKNTFLLFLYLIISNSFAQFKSKIVPLNEENHLAFDTVVEAKDLNKEVLYKKLKTWVLENIKTTDNNIQFDDTGFEMIITTPTILLSNTRWNVLTGQKVNFKLKLLVKDNKFRIVAGQFMYYAISNTLKQYNEPLEGLKFKNFYPDPIDQIQNSFDTEFEKMIKSIVKAAQTNSKSDEW